MMAEEAVPFLKAELEPFEVQEAPLRQRRALWQLHGALFLKCVMILAGAGFIWGVFLHVCAQKGLQISGKLYAGFPGGSYEEKPDSGKGDQYLLGVGKADITGYLLSVVQGNDIILIELGLW